ncbi:hypothetical protein VM1G_02166 [Cytospora mali]|uniref:Antigenic thaumatin-like protein n=1 Tax=Cytospora mali TaxID=578113 RepID=A0A194VR43_CYTMA|nr:hypothetical protein VM1G_02166 [Valsa mali]
MLLMHHTIAIMLLAFVLATGSTGSFLNVQNHCSFSVYCIGTRSNNAMGNATGIVEVLAGASWENPWEALDNDYGTALKCSPDKTVPDDNQYQLEVTLNGTSWLDLSIFNGEPFTGYERAAYFPAMGSKCRKLECAPGQHTCEWCPKVGEASCDPPTYIICDTTVADAWMYLCSYGT